MLATASFSRIACDHTRLLERSIVLGDERKKKREEDWFIVRTPLEDYDKKETSHPRSEPDYFALPGAFFLLLLLLLPPFPVFTLP